MEFGFFSEGMAVKAQSHFSFVILHYRKFHSAKLTFSISKLVTYVPHYFQSEERLPSSHFLNF